MEGYNYFLDLLIGLLKNYRFSSYDDIIKYFNSNQKTLNFNIETSGTTSTPKIISVKLENCIRYVKTNRSSNLIRFWGMGYPAGSYASTQVFFQSFMNKETIIYLYGTDFKSLDNLFSKYRITNLSCTPTFLSMMLINMNSVYPTVSKITTGGEKMKDNLIDSFKKTFVNAEYVNIYASTETGSLLYSNSELFSIPEKYKEFIKVEEGTLRVHKSYLNFSSDIKVENGWFNTNDIVEWVNDTQFRFISRSNGFLNTGGYRVSPTEIEETILKIKNVNDVHVYGKPNSLLGTIVCADVIGKNIDSKIIKSDMMKLTDKHKIPQIIRIVDTFEFVSNGKKKLMI